MLGVMAGRMVARLRGPVLRCGAMTAGRKVRTPQGAVVGNAHRPGNRVGKVPQKINRHGRPSGRSG